MALHNGIDTVAVASLGVYTETYGAADPNEIANIFASRGYLEEAPEPSNLVATDITTGAPVLGNPTLAERVFRDAVKARTSIVLAPNRTAMVAFPNRTAKVPKPNRTAIVR